MRRGVAQVAQVSATLGALLSRDARPWSIRARIWCCSETSNARCWQLRIWSNNPMRGYSLGRGRRKAVKRFTNRQGFWILITLLLLGILTVYLVVFLHVDVE